MRKYFQIGVSWVLIFFAATFLSSSLPISKFKHQEEFSNQPKPIFYTTLSTTFHHNGCDITFAHTIAYITDDHYRLIDVVVFNDYDIYVDCGGGPLLYTRNASEITFTVEHGSVVDVEFSNSVPTILKEIYSDPGFRQEYVDWIDINKP